MPAWPRMLFFVVAGLLAGALVAGLLKRAGSRPSPLLLAGLIVVGGVAGLLLSHVPGLAGGERVPRTPVVVLASAAQFDQAIESAATPVLVDFYADWCPPCRLLEPMLEEFHTEWGGRVAFYRVNVDETPKLARRFQVEVLPTLVLLGGGREVGRILGLPPRGELEALLAGAGGDSAQDHQQDHQQDHGQDHQHVAP